MPVIDLTNDVPQIQYPSLLLMGNESVLNDDESMESGSFDKLIGDFLALKPDAEVQAFQGPGSTHSGVYWITHMSDGYHGIL